jgi:predicted ATPase
MLTYLELENFRAFSKRARIEIRPITVLIGKNSSGKSSVLKFLQMLRQTVQKREGDFLETTGEHVHLGAWGDLRNKRSRSHYFSCRLGYRGKTSPFMANIEVGKGATGMSISARPSKVTGGSFVFSDSEPELDYEISARRYYRAGGERGEHRIHVSQSGRNEGEEIWTRTLFEKKIASIQGSSFLRIKATSASPEDVLRNIGEDMKYIAPARNWFSKVEHLAATRAEPEQTFQSGSPPIDEVGHNGQYTLAHLAETLSKKNQERAFVAKHLANILQVDNLTAQETIRGLLTRFQARNTITQATHWLADFGFGVSQCLPIIVQGALMEKGDLLTVEQPEAQLHPTAQLELGSLFADLWKDRGVSSIIETHSGNVLLRLRKLVRLGPENGGLSPGDVGVAYFHADRGVTEVVNMSVKPDGELDGSLPMEFFGADLFEALEFNTITPSGSK